jgi:hypothetical protein
MSFFDDASLAFLPSGAAGKDGKAYSIKPTDGTGDFTFSRGSNLAATRVGADGLIEKGRENLLLQSNQFDTTWDDSSIITLTSGQQDKDGGTSAWKLAKGAASSFLYQSITTSGVNTFSLYAKADTTNWIMLQVSAIASVRTFFDLSNGVLGSSLSNVINAEIESIGNGWYRCSFTYNGNAGAVRVFPADGNNNTSGTTGSIYIQSAQLEIGLAATDVIETGATTGKAGLLEDEPRFDYSGGATCPSLLLEPSRTNSLGQSEYFDGYYANFGGVSFDTNTSETLSPEGLYNATKLISSTNNTQQAIYKNYTLSTPTLTCYAKAAEYTSFALKLSGGAFATFTLTGNGSTGYSPGVTAKSIEPVGNGWYKCSISTTANSVYAWIAISSGNLQGDGTSGIYIWGAQLEEGSYPTSYIPNHSGGSVTRGADSCTGAGDASTFNDSEGVLYAEISALANDGTFRNISVSNGTTAQAIRIYYRSNDNQITFLLGSATGGSVTTSISSATDFIKVAAKYDTDTIKLFVNGVLTNTLGSLTMPTGLQQLDFNIAGVLPFYGNSKQILYFPEALSDADCITLTT